MEKQIIIVAGGSGLRMGSDIPKQFLKIGNLPVLMRTINLFHRFDSTASIILVLPASQQNYWKALCAEYNFNVPVKIATGGDTRFQSVKNGLALASLNGLIAVHDGVRPFVSTQTLMNCFQTAALHGSVIPVIAPVESIRQETDGGNIAVDRDKIKLVQTPQVFKAEIIQNAYRVNYNPLFTDDASVVEANGHAIHLVDGNRENIKITTSVDLALGAYFLAHQEEF